MILVQPLIFRSASITGVRVKMTDLYIGIQLLVTAGFQREHAQVLKQEAALYDSDGTRRVGLKSVELAVEIDRAQLAFRSHDGDMVVKIVASYVHGLEVAEPKKGKSGSVVLNMVVDFEGDPVELMSHLVMMRGKALALGIASAQDKFNLRPQLEDDILDPDAPKAQPDGTVLMRDDEGNDLTIDGAVWDNLVRSLSQLDTDGPGEQEPESEE